MAVNYYHTLGVKPKATQDEIKKAYRKKAMAAHPDVNKSPGATDQFVRINEAYEILSDPQKRSVYDNRINRRSPKVNGTQSQAQKDAAYADWVAMANARARQSARMSYDDFKRSRFARAEESVFLYLQFVIMGAMFLMGLFILTLPVVGMLFVDWKAIFFCLVTTPIAIKIFQEARSGVKQIRESL